MSTEKPQTIEEAVAALDKLFDDPKRWTKHALARDGDGVACFPGAERAVCWCLTGGVYRVAGMSDSFSSEVMAFLTAKNNWVSLTRFNDHPDTDFERLKRFLAG